MSKRFIFFLLLFQISISTHASTLNWSWEFSPSAIVFDKTVDKYVYITVKNDVTSTVSLDMSASFFNFSDGTFGDRGLIRDSEGAVFAWPTLFGNPTAGILNPGEEIIVSYFVFNQALDNSSETVFVNPLFYVFEDDPSGPFYDSSLLHSQHSDNSLILSYAAVPLPSAFILFASGLSLLMLRVGRVSVRLSRS